ncbi:MAG: hypothetical protein QOG63_1414 [Thermoleophilaceae bacterium]|jgi:pSer/pThr/pTyr-binding forkhead associated (FHA) protein|nr:hypothetical protein [Thermoleophilaceae bacterium]
MAGELLRCTAGRLAGQDLPVVEGLVFGRSAGEPGSLGGDHELSRTHARLSRDPAGRLVIEDLGSTNGTWINRVRISAPQVLNPGDELRVGQTVFTVVAPAVASAPPPTQPLAAPPTSAPPPTPVQPPAPAVAAQAGPGGTTRLRVTAGNLAGQEIPVEQELLIGRSFPGVGPLGGDNRVSRRHARFALGPGGLLFVEDSGSTNGTFVNGVIIRGPRSLRDGDQVQIGATTLVVAGAHAPSFAAPAAPAAQAVVPAVGAQPGVAAPFGFVPQGAAPARRRSGVIIAAFAAFLAVVVGVSIAVVSAIAPNGPKKCALDQPCQGPPTASPLANQARFKSSLGYTVQYNDEILEVRNKTATSIDLGIDNTKFGSISITVEGSPSSQVSPDQAVQTKLNDIGGRVVGLQKDDRPENQIFQPTIGYHEGVGGAYAGTVNSPQGAGAPVNIVVMAAADDKTTVLTTVVTDSPDDESRNAILGLAGDIIKTLRFPSDGAT